LRFSPKTAGGRQLFFRLEDGLKLLSPAAPPRALLRKAGGDPLLPILGQAILREEFVGLHADKFLGEFVCASLDIDQTHPGGALLS